MSRTKSGFAKLVLLPVLVGLATACGFLETLRSSRRAHQASSIVQYLYPDKADPVVTPTVPVLSLPRLTSPGDRPGPAPPPARLRPRQMLPNFSRRLWMVARVRGLPGEALLA